MTTFVHIFRVRYHETDPQRFVFNSRYLEYADVAMTEYFRHLGWDYPELLELGFDPSLVATQIEFLRPATLDESLKMHVRCSKIGTSSTELRFELTRNDQTLSVIHSTYVNVDLRTGRATPIPTAIAAALTADRTTSDGELEQ
ncbi:thioesterase family protein [Microbacterium sp. X-17]|uniref:acyl-CoA thioesterase n=1 Tax=Microbacterium sp. X-17 TaxID=3144404 RepID=UPI0031F4AA0D